VVGIYQRKFSFQTRLDAPALTSRDPAMDITVSSTEYALGHTHNLATDSQYRDPTLGLERTTEVSDEEMLSDWMVSLIKTMRADMDNDKLYPPGRVYILVCRVGLGRAG
jgi:hypothetical protein